MIPGEVIIKNEFIEINANKNIKKITVTNIGDKPIQIGSHFHFFEINKYMKFNREEAYGYRLDIPSGTAIRFEANETKEVQLVELGGNKIVKGLNNLTDAQVNVTTKEKSLLNAKLKGFE